MSGEQSYLVRVLRKVESSLTTDHRLREGALLGKIIQRISHTNDVHRALDRLYCVKGFDQFALRLMWTVERAGIASNGLQSAVIDHEVEALAGLLSSSGEAGDEDRQVSAGSRAGESLADLYNALHSFGKAIEEMKRRSYDRGKFTGIDVEMLYRLLNETAVLEAAATAASKEEVVWFAKSFSGFVHHVMDKNYLHDIRAMNVLDNANLTLQTVTQASGIEEYDSLSQTIELLQQPSRLLE
jgi:hypothetical protein